MTLEQGQAQLSTTADRVRARVGRNQFRRWMGQGEFWIPILAILAVLGARVLMGSTGGEWTFVLGLIAAYAIMGWAWSSWRRLSRLDALSLWDEKGDRHDLFSSAWSFIQERDVSGDTLEEGRKRHLQRAFQELPEASKRIAQDLPSPSVGWGWALVVVALGFSLSSLLRVEPAPGEGLLSEAMAEEAQRQAAELSKEKSQFDKISGLTKEEQEEVEKLKASVDGVAEDLAESDGKTAREVLEGLETRARAAERLAQQLGASSNEWASEELIREMSQHADTADLAASIKDKNAEQAADESDVLSGMLESPELKLETQERVTSALERSMAKATEDDATKPVGERVGNASRKLQEKQATTAGREFAELAKHFRRVSEREEAEKKLRDLADKLREAGSSISGSKMEKMQQLASGGQGQKPGQQPGGNQNLQPLSQAPTPNSPGMTPMTPTPSPGQQAGGQQQAIGTGQNMPIPGMQTPQGQGQQQGQKGGAAMPIPGTGQKGQVQQGLAAGGQGQKPGQQPGGALMAPIPGQSPGGGMPGAALGAAGGQASMGAQGGNQAGTGTMGLGNQTSEAIKAAQDAKVVTQLNEGGDSTVRAIEGKARSEQAQRQQQEMIVEFIQVEEEALDEAALPLSRRDHVLRYFTALREEFEKSN